ncbi:MAG: hypothetical protein L0220_32780, partial [Acidobacteria bacterium]|nr:hypothetical protein [Acidobacteriota bacterium]
QSLTWGSNAPASLDGRVSASTNKAGVKLSATEYNKAFELHQRWYSRFPEDRSILPDFAETHFTTGRFDECEKRVTELLADPEIQASAKIALRAIEIADLLALGQAKQISAKIDALLTEISQQSATFKVGWSFNGTRNFIGQNEKLSAYRDWLRGVFDALAGKDRDTILQSLREAQKRFR